MPDAPTTATATALAPSALRRTSLTRIARAPGARKLQAINMQLLAAQVDSSPIFSDPPIRVDAAFTATDGVAYFVPMARVAKRSRATQTPHVFIDKRDGGHVLQVQFELVRHANVPAEAVPLALTDVTVMLVCPDAGQTIALTPQDLPAAEGDEGIVKKLFCEGPVDVNVAINVLQGDAPAWFEVQGQVHYRQQPSAAPGNTGIVPPGMLERVRMRRMRDMAVTEVQTDVAAFEAAPIRMARPALSGALNINALKAIDGLQVDWQAVDPGSPPAPTPQSAAVQLDVGHVGVEANFPTANVANRAIYAMVSSAFGADPGQPWVDASAGSFAESAIPDEFHVLPDEYRLEFDVEQLSPSMFVLLVPGAQPTDYRLRCRFAIVPWFDPARLDALREEIAAQTGIAFPQLALGGVPAATFALSALYRHLGASTVGGADEAPLAVDPRGFELVLDCTSEFYALLARMLVSTGVEGEVALSLPAGDGAQPRVVTRPVRLRLDAPALDFLTSRLEAPAEDAPAEAPARLVIANPAQIAVTVAGVRPTLLVMDEDMPSPIQAVAATAQPPALALEPAAEATVTLIPGEPAPGGVWGGVAVSLDGVAVALDAKTVLARIQELGSATGLQTSVTVRCFQLQHPDTLPATHADLFGLEVQLRRGEAADPVTVYVTRDAPEQSVEVAFTLADILAGATPEQPKFSWRRRNMAAAGTGEWSEWETIVGRQLFVAPVGL